MTDNDNFKALISRIENGNYSDEDLLQYNAWCNAQQDVKEEVDLLDKNQQMFLFIKKKIKRKRQRYIFLRIATAAAFLLFFFLHQYWKTNKDTHSEVLTSIIESHQIPEGFNKAILTLFNGDTVHLTSDMKQNRFVQDNSITSVSFEKLSISDRSTEGDKSELHYNTLATLRGQQFQITLSDGTKIWLNASSSIRYPLSFSNQKERKVELIGEAYFEVKKNVDQPFIVTSRNQEVKVLGTHFNINSYPDEPVIKTTLLEGSVEINRRLLLQPGEQSIVGNGNLISKVSVDPNIVTAWKKGYFEFRNENIYEIMRKVVRFHNIQVEFEGNIPLDGMSGQIRIKDDIVKILDILASTRILKITQKDNKIYIRKY
ncbi:FecR family protein [Sphingobacterium spiritivorum]|uniref:FecR family protein n=1 Tax=Sphingobacterium spiritivorum TaxID=258 RepID=UPI003DA4184C